MKLTKIRLKQIIKEELSDIVEAGEAAEILAAMGNIPKVAAGIVEKIKRETEEMAEKVGINSLALNAAIAELLTVD